MRYKVLTTALIAAISNQEPAPVGAVYEPKTELDKQEAKSLQAIGYVEETTAKVDLRTKFERDEEAKKNAGKTDATAAPPISGTGKVNAIKQDDGTFKSDQGVRVHEDGSAFEEGDQVHVDFLAGNVGDIAEAISKSKDKPHPRLLEVEKANGNRKGVVSALEAASK